MVRHWNRSPREITQETFKARLDGLALSNVGRWKIPGELDLKGPFQFKPFCDSAKEAKCSHQALLCIPTDVEIHIHRQFSLLSLFPLLKVGLRKYCMLHCFQISVNSKFLTGNEISPSNIPFPHYFSGIVSTTQPPFKSFCLLRLKGKQQI